MTVDTSMSLDIETLRRGYQEWDFEALLGLYADEVELVQIDRDNPPSSPHLRARGRPRRPRARRPVGRPEAVRDSNTTIG
jgi:hypothetical protein